MIRQNRVFTNYDIRSIEDSGSFSAVANDFTAVDDYGTRFTAESVQESLDEWQKRSEVQRMPLVLHHDERLLIGHPGNMRATDTSLEIQQGQLLTDDIQIARDARVYMREKLMTGFSLAFYEQRSHRDGKVKVFDKVKIRHVALVLWPSNESSRLLAVREAIDSGRYPTEREFEEHLQMIGLSKSDARTFVRNGYHEAWKTEGLFSIADTSEELRSVNDALSELLKELRAINHKERTDHERGTESPH